MPTPFVRVEDATLVPEGASGRFVLSRLESVAEVAATAARSGARVEVTEGRLRIVSTLSRVADAVGRVLGKPAADEVRSAVEQAIASWLGAPPDVAIPAGPLPTSQRPLVMGVLNVTPDSFSDGGAFYDPATHPAPAIEHGRRLRDEGADILDVGGESTRPGAEPVPVKEELRRVVPVIEALAAEGATVSVDTTKAKVARAAVEAGAAVVNDVSAGALDKALLSTVADLGVPYVLMHMQGTPRTMQQGPAYDDVVAEVFDFLAAGLERLADVGIPAEHVLIDPGIGFGKTVEHNLALLRATRQLTSLGRPVVIGTSRKSFLGTVSGSEDPIDRLEGSLVSAADAVRQGAAVVRVHDVRETVRAVRVAAALAPST